MNNTQFVPVFHPYDTVQAGLVRSTLEATGILCYVNNENGSAMQLGGAGAGVGNMTVMVPENQAKRANEILKERGMAN
jgi:hypothetical protein